MRISSYLYDTHFDSIRRKFTKTKLKGELTKKRVEKVLSNMSERDRHYLALYEVYKFPDVISKVEEVTPKKAARRVEIALNHLMSPKNVVEIAHVDMFKHEGRALMSDEVFSERTVRALRRSNITTTGDLECWISLGPRFLFTIPGVGRGGVIEILTWYFRRKEI